VSFQNRRVLQHKVDLVYIVTRITTAWRTRSCFTSASSSGLLFSVSDSEFVVMTGAADASGLFKVQCPEATPAGGSGHDAG
jgi:hypothetical protein